MPTTNLTYKMLWSGTWANTSPTAITLNYPASGYDELRFVHYEDYAGGGAYKCTDTNARVGSKCIWLPFYENSWYSREYKIALSSDYKTLYDQYGRQVMIQKSPVQSWSGTNRSPYMYKVYGITYNDSAYNEPDKIVGNRTLLYDNGGLYENENIISAVTSYTVSQPFSSFEFIEFESSNPRENFIAPSDFKYVTPTYFLQSDTNWYWRSTQWTRTNSTTITGKQYLQMPITTTANYTPTSGNIPAPYGRNVNFVRIWGVGKKV